MDEVILGMNPRYTSNSSLYIALEKGFFQEEHVNVTVKPFESANAVNVAIASGSVDVGGTGLTADLYNMIAAGQKITIAADKGREHKDYHFSAVVVSADSQIQSIEELKGKRAGVTTIGSTLHYNLARILENHGLAADDVQWVPMNSIRGVIDALRGKNIDAAVLNEPNVTQAVTEGFGKVLAWVADEIDFQSSGILFSPKFAANEDAGVRFLKAYLKGARYYYDAVLIQQDGKQVPGENYDEVVQIVAKYTKQPEDTIKQSFSYIDPNGQLNIENIQEQIDWYAKENLITEAVNAKDIVV
jgi:NitT/TauT family transport system substrate-binding protein